jgi:heme A synthase
MVVSHAVPPVPRWLHAWAVFTAGVTAVLLGLGGVVTTFRVGMSDPVWPTYPWHLLLISWDEPQPGFVIEHTHRLAGYLVGCCVIVLAAGLWLTAWRRGLAWLGTAALLGVIAQGVLGGLRVLLNAPAGGELAVVHGCSAQVVFGLIVALAVLTASPAAADDLSPDAARKVRRATLVLVGLVFVQLVWGALVRHLNGTVAPRLHVLTAFAVVAAAAWLVKTTLDHPAGRRLLGRTSMILAILLVVQLCLGVEAWMGRYASPLPPEAQPVTVGQAVVRTAHLLVGSWVLATAVVAAVQAHRTAAAVEVHPEPERFVAPSPSEAVRLPATATLTANVSRLRERTT